MNVVEKYCDKVPLADIQPGDFLLYKYGRCVSHGGIYVGDGRIIHALVDYGVVMTDIDDVMFLTPKGQSRLHGVYRFRKER